MAAKNKKKKARDEVHFLHILKKFATGFQRSKKDPSRKKAKDQFKKDLRNGKLGDWLE